MNREEYKNSLNELLNDLDPDGDNRISTGEPEEIIYKIDDLYVYGQFDYGSRGLDHNILLEHNIDWEDVLAYGTVVVPESKVYISNESDFEFDELGYKRLPLDSNHIVGFKEETDTNLENDIEHSYQLHIQDPVIQSMFDNGLTEEQYLMYANEGFNNDQLAQIYSGYVEGLTDEQVATYAKHDYSQEQMYQIETGYIEGLSEDQVAVYADPEFDEDQMEAIRLGYMQGLTDEQVAVYANDEYSDLQMDQIRKGYESGLTEEQIELYANPEFDEDQMEAIRECAREGLTQEQLESVANPELDWEEMYDLSDEYAVENQTEHDEMEL